MSNSILIICHEIATSHYHNHNHNVLATKERGETPSNEQQTREIFRSNAEHAPHAGCLAFVELAKCCVAKAK